MSYELTNFEDWPSKKTPVNAETLNKMDKQIKKSADDIGEITKLADLGDNLSDIVDAVYKKLNKVQSHVGMIVQSTTLDTEAKVKNIYGGSKWVKIEGRMLLGANASHEVNSTGGEETHTLSSNEIPSHSHGFSFDTSTSYDGTHAHTLSGMCQTSDDGSHSHSATVKGNTSINGDHSHGFDRCAGSGTNTFNYAGGSVSAIALNKTYHQQTYNGGSHGHYFEASATVGYNGTHRHTVNVRGKADNNGSHAHSVSYKGNTSNIGGGSAHNNMPPYKAVYIWERTA